MLRLFWGACVLGATLGCTPDADPETALRPDLATDAAPETVSVAIERYNLLSEQVRQEYPTLEIPPLELSYVDNLNNLGTSQRLRLQQQAIEQYKSKFNAIDVAALPFCQALDVRLVLHRFDQDLARAALGIQYNLQRPEVLTDKGISHVPLGKEWYQFFLRAWLGAEVSPEEIAAFGEAQTAQAVAKYRAIQKQLGFENNDIGLEVHLSNPAFFLAHQGVIRAHFKQKQTIIHDNLSKLFPNAATAPVEVKKSTRDNFTVPGYYDPTQKVFYYTLFDGLYDTRQTDWLLLHEGTPGHHYQISRETTAECETTLPQEDSTFREGWAAYVETLGGEFGLYQRPEEQLGAIEWDMVRSARVVLDVGINYYGWSDAQALAWWQEHVVLQEAIAQREIDRIRRWPAQVITYKYGADVFMRLKENRLASMGEDFDITQYHEDILHYGSIPLSVLEEMMVSTSKPPASELE